MSHKNRDKGRMAPFVPLYKLTMKHPAWRALSHGARSTYMLLMSNYNTKQQNYVYLAVRKGAEELGSNMKSVARWLHELQFYGFIFKLTDGCLGVEGKALAPHWRLTEVPFAGALPTRDFEKWDGVLFDPKKQNPVPVVGTPRTSRGNIRRGWKMTKKPPACTSGGYIETTPPCTTKGNVTTSTTPSRGQVVQSA